MKHLILLLACFIPVFLGCRKNEKTSEQEDLKEIVTAKAWLKAYINKSPKSSQSHLIQLENSVLWSTGEVVHSSLVPQLIIFKLNPAFKTGNINVQRSDKFIIFYKIDDAEGIVKATITEVISTRPITSLKQVGGLYDHSFIFDDCIVSHLMLDNTLIHEDEFRGGKIFSSKHLAKKKKAAYGKSVATGCTDWYLVTTFYYSDGSSDQTWQYLFTTCDDTQSCTGKRIFNVPGQLFKLECGGTGAAGEESNTGKDTRICGSYNWQKIGDGYTVELLKAGSAFHKEGTNFTINAVIEMACVTIPAYNLSMKEATAILNEAHNYAQDRIKEMLNSGILEWGDYTVSQEMIKQIDKRLKSYNVGCLFIKGGCTGQVNQSTAQYCK